jgi:NAD(P)-dependent dehydrogenase (short-subunit alcohol dehydrogenase family)
MATQPTVVITGGSGGIATACHTLLTQAGWTVLAPNRDELDITNRQNVVTWFANYPTVKTLINAAGFIRPASVIDSDQTIWMKHFEVNVFGAYFCTQAVLKQNPHAHIINIASTSGLEGRPEWSAYCASKAAMLSLTQSLAREQVLSHAFSPARTATPMRERLFPGEDPKTLLQANDVAEVVCQAVITPNHWPSGTNVIIKKDGLSVHPLATE